MISISAREAFAAYEAVRQSLPSAQPRPLHYREIETLEEVADDFDVFLLDAFGVLNIGDTAIPGMRERIDGLRAKGKHVVVVSNAASVPKSELHAKYGRLGFDFSETDIITSRGTMAATLKHAEAITWGVMHGHDARMDDFGDLSTVSLQDDGAVYGDVGGFMLIGCATWTEKRQAILEDALRETPRRVVVANPDIVAPRERGFSVQPGYFAHRLAAKTGIRPEFFGKPFNNIFDHALEPLGPLDRSRVLMVGDSLHTDILGAQTAGIPSALVSQAGFFAGEDVSTAIATSGIVPDFLVARQ